MADTDTTSQQAKRRAHELLNDEIAESSMDMFDVRDRLGSLLAEAERDPRLFIERYGRPRHG